MGLNLTADSTDFSRQKTIFDKFLDSIEKRRLFSRQKT